MFKLLIFFLFFIDSMFNSQVNFNKKNLVYLASSLISSHLFKNEINYNSLISTVNKSIPSVFSQDFINAGIGFGVSKLLEIFGKKYFSGSKIGILSKIGLSGLLFSFIAKTETFKKSGLSILSRFKSSYWREEIEIENMYKKIKNLKFKIEFLNQDKIEETIEEKDLFWLFSQLTNETNKNDNWKDIIFIEQEEQQLKNFLLHDAELNVDLPNKIKNQIKKFELIENLKVKILNNSDSNFFLTVTDKNKNFIKNSVDNNKNLSLLVSFAKKQKEKLENLVKILDEITDMTKKNAYIESIINSKSLIFNKNIGIFLGGIAGSLIGGSLMKNLVTSEKIDGLNPDSKEIIDNNYATKMASDWQNSNLEKLLYQSSEMVKKIEIENNNKNFKQIIPVSPGYDSKY